MKKIILAISCLLGAALITRGQEVENRVETVHLSDTISTMGRLGGIAVDQLGYIYVANFRDKVWRVSPTGEVKLFAEGLYGASGNTIDDKGNLLQSNFYSNSITKINRDGEKMLLADKNIQGPVGITTDGQGNIYVCNCGGNNISKITPDGNSIIYSESEMYNCPNGITEGPDGKLYITNYGNDLIVRVSADGKADEFVNLRGGEGNAHIVFMKDNFYVTKIKSNSLHRVTPDGKSFLVAGQPGQLGFKDGPATSSTMSRPNGIAKDPYGSTLYVDNLKGDWIINGPGHPGSIVIRKIDIKTVTEIFDEVLNKKGLDAAVAAYWKYKKDPSHQHEDTGVETGTYAWQLMIQRKVPEAIRVFTLMTETYPERWRPYYYLGEVYKLLGQPDKAKDYYKQSLKKFPDNPLVVTKLKQLGD